MPQLAEEVEFMMHNLILFLHHKYGEKVLSYFINKVLEAAKEDSWDQTTQYLICSTDGFIEEEKEDLIGLKGAQIYIKVNKYVLEAQNKIASWPDMKSPEEKLVAT